LLSIFHERFNFRLFDDRRFLLSRGVFFRILAVLENSAGEFTISINNRQTEILCLTLLPFPRHLVPGLLPKLAT